MRKSLNFDLNAFESKTSLQPAFYTKGHGDDHRFKRQRRRIRDEFPHSKAAAEKQDLIFQQDMILEDMASIVDRLTTLGSNMGEELGEHVIILEDVNEETEEVGTRFEIYHKKLGKLIERSGRSYCKIILCLSIIDFILLLLLIYW